MGSFSFMKADNLTKYANIYYDCPFKFIIPAEFGGGYIRDHYQDYGYLGHKDINKDSPKYDMFERLAFWNAELVISNHKELQYNGMYDGKPLPRLKEIDKYTNKNRLYGIQIFHEKNLKYPLKLVSASYKGTYETCKNYSTSDPHQGFEKTLRHP